MSNILGSAFIEISTNIHNGEPYLIKERKLWYDDISELHFVITFSINKSYEVQRTLLISGLKYKSCNFYNTRTIFTIYIRCINDIDRLIRSFGVSTGISIVVHGRDKIERFFDGK